ncbi:ABC transporter ATP-binding protein [Breznakiella homolactica]|uniref:ABC transporter ATP-binding protein n=1 Tax=Breznakiella homolactica TaxID=2798577 RepID=A0A7T7XLZ5_9SPIR|nr:ABC transporter ATP-binding protein [Breznakiella homolactica]QQO08770.1 ABC transporter ATP-binding protein/permease [Breznakiella homolactica]
MFSIFKRLPPVQTILAIVFLFLQTGCALYLPYLMAGMVDQGIMAGDFGFIWKQGGTMLGIAALSLTGALLNMYIAGRIAFRLGKELREEIFTKVLSFSKTEYDRFGTSVLITRNTSDVTQVQTVVEMFFKFLILSPIYLIGGICLTWKLNPALALPFAAVVPFMALAAAVIYRFAVPLYGKMQSLLDRLNLLFREGITGVRVIRAFAREEVDYEKYRTTNRDYTGTAIAAGTIMSVFVPLITLIISLAALAIVWIGGNSTAGGNMDVGAIMAALSYSAQILMGFGLLTNVLLILPRGQVSARRIREVLDTPLSLQDPLQPEPAGAVSLSFIGVSFSYPGAAKPALSDISFTVGKGQTLAIAGGTGDGKSTLLSLIPRFYDVQSGSIRIGGTDVRSMVQNDLRKLVSYTPQKSALLAGTVRSNLLLAKPGAGDEELWAVLEDACAAEFIRELPEGLDSPVEKGGANFSGGQRQRLCIARTIIKEADIYLFDDSFSALDFKTDAAVRGSLKRRLEDKIVVLVAQRAGTTANADCIAVLDKGVLAGLGTHNELLKNSPVYREIIRSQGYEEEAA